MSNPDQIEEQLGRTRTDLGSDVDRLTTKGSPKALAGRQMDKMKGNAGSWKERVMGVARDAAATASDKADAATSKAGDAAGNGPQAVTDKAAGNPLAAGLIAFGLGWLASSVAPASDVERKAAKQIEDNAQGLVQPLQESVQEVAGNLQQPLQDAAEQVRSTASDAAARTTEHAKSATDDVTQPLTT